MIPPEINKKRGDLIMKKWTAVVKVFIVKDF